MSLSGRLLYAARSSYFVPSVAITTSYSYRSAITGSMRVARRAGSQTANEGGDGRDSESGTLPENAQ